VEKNEKNKTSGKNAGERQEVCPSADAHVAAKAASVAVEKHEAPAVAAAV
jgi:hypothetical protein